MILLIREYRSFSNLPIIVLKNRLGNVLFDATPFFFNWLEIDCFRRFLSMTAAKVLRLWLFQYFIRSNSQIWIRIKSWSGTSLEVTLFTLSFQVRIHLMKRINTLSSYSLFLCSLRIKFVGFGYCEWVNIIKGQTNSVRIGVRVQRLLLDQKGRPLEHFPFESVIVKYFLWVVLIVVHFIRFWG